MGAAYLRKGFSKMRTHLLAATAVFALSGFATTSAFANTVSVTYAGMDTSPSVVHLSTGESVYMAPMEFIIGGAPFLVWCIDLDHNIVPGPQGPANNYEIVTLADYFGSGDPGMLDRLTGLAYAGSQQAHGPGMNPYQGSIWDTVHPGVVDGGDLGVLAQVAALDGTAFSMPWSKAIVLKSLDNSQTFLGFGVPEPSTWALMIGGFGLAGLALRRRRSLAIAL